MIIRENGGRLAPGGWFRVRASSIESCTLSIVVPGVKQIELHEKEMPGGNSYNFRAIARRR